ncbi:MAG: nonstructural protein [Arizlama microvirus]|nr:MAG: nonstructural protein [Arizlama microvirus]
MLISIFAVKDIKVSEFKNPFLQTSAIEAVRGFTVAMRDENTLFSQFPEDFELHEIAQFDNVAGKIKSYETSKFITSGPQIKNLDKAIKEASEATTK